MKDLTWEEASAKGVKVYEYMLPFTLLTKEEEICKAIPLDSNASLEAGYMFAAEDKALKIIERLMDKGRVDIICYLCATLLEDSHARKLIRKLKNEK